MPSSVDPMYFVAAHEAGHAVAYILAHRALGRGYPSFHRVLIRRNSSSPYIDLKNRKVDCVGLCEAPDIYTRSIGLAIFKREPEQRPGLKVEILSTMEWAILISLAGPFAEAASRDIRSRRDMRFTALLGCGGKADYSAAEAVLLDYKTASMRRHGQPHFENRTRDLVLKSWPAIDALAKTLLVKGTLDHDDAYAIVAPFLETS